MKVYIMWIETGDEVILLARDEEEAIKLLLEYTQTDRLEAVMFSADGWWHCPTNTGHIMFKIEPENISTCLSDTILE